MIQFRGEDGGRHLYNEDMLDLQDLALSFTQLFVDCGGDFVISGCEVIRQSNKWYVNEGFVWLDGKIRKVEKTQVSKQYPLYIVPRNTAGKSIPYAVQGITGLMFIDYGAAVQTSKPSSGKYIAMRSQEYGFENLRSVFFNHYALTNGVGKQEVDSNVLFEDLNVENKRYGNSQRYAEVTTGGQGRTLKIKFVESGIVRKVFEFHIEDREIKVYNTSGQVIHSFQGEFDGNTILPILTLSSLDSDIFKTVTLQLSGYHTDSWFFVKEDTGWLRVERNWGMIYCRQVYRDVYIAGRLTIMDDTFISSENKGGYWLRKTNFRLPEQITPPSSEFVFVMRGGTLPYNGSTNWKIGTDRYFYMESDEQMLMKPAPSTFYWHYYI